MELNAEQIKKALECFHQRILNTDLAKKITETEMMAIIDALALINELTEENERLHASCTELTRKLEIANLEIECKERICESYMLQYGTVADKEVFLKKERADTVRKMQERLKEAPIKVGLPLFGLQTKDEVEDYANELILQMRDAIDQIAKEMLEGTL